MCVCVCVCVYVCVHACACVCVVQSSILVLSQTCTSMCVLVVSFPSNKSVTESAARRSLTSSGKRQHCRRHTQGHAETYQQLEDLLLSLAGVTDGQGIPLFNTRMTTIRQEQKKEKKQEKTWVHSVSRLHQLVCEGMCLQSNK